ncbi:MAG: fumarylacetoacetate hydrolase family protein [Bacteroidales bacterium]|nr:fumarylacetoacetate hydrolase family protein [Bacteroidales bacterium]MDD2387455.1 fumarylacetoacetate hydrolase family protein [Bacteroidales bacterium]MDD4218144.1 fumarylacetoacetate hydrolase family protein [Bacteroidales bacterium]MDY0140633.1 fumarylacetoacetate hydrolase family protein [Bacteroidales bacterium]
MKIICIGRNYKNHIKELNSKIPDQPVFFLKPESAVLRNNIFFIPHFSNDVQYETELVLRINRLGKHIQSKFAYRYFDAIGIGIDITARDIQSKCKKEGLPWEISKAFDGSAVLSDFIPVSEFEDINQIKFELTKNDEIVQKGNSADVIFNFAEIISYVSQFMTLKIGDLIFTGTPEGIGKMNSGDVYRAYLQGREMINFKVK